MYDIKVLTFDLVISRYCNTISNPMSNKNFDIVPISSVQGRSKLNIVHDIDGFPSISKQYRVYKDSLFGASSTLYPISTQATISYHDTINDF
jgi:hypothetical protein